MADTKTFAATPASLQSLGTLLASHGITIDPTQPSGDVAASGWAISWATPQAGEIAITVNKHPFAEESFLWSHLAGALGKPIA